MGALGMSPRLPEPGLLWDILGGRGAAHRGKARRDLVVRGLLSGSAAEGLLGARLSPQSGNSRQGHLCSREVSPRSACALFWYPQGLCLLSPRRTAPRVPHAGTGQAPWLDIVLLGIQGWHGAHWTGQWTGPSQSFCPRPLWTSNDLQLLKAQIQSPGDPCCVLGTSQHPRLSIARGAWERCEAGVLRETKWGAASPIAQRLGLI